MISSITKNVFLGMLMFASEICCAQQTFTNPLLPAGADPWVIQKDGYYYYTNTTGSNVTLWKTRNISDLINAEKKIVWIPPSKGAYSHDIWAPEIHFFKGKWYIYFAADRGRNESHRLYVLENTSQDPLKGKWIMKGELKTPEDKWAIDASVFENNEKLYLIWSGWKGKVNGEQDIFIAKMKDPWTAEGTRTLLSTPSLAWEKNGDLNNPNDVSHVNVNEGPEILKHGNNLFLIYSASGCWTDTYALGMLSTTVNADLLNADSWTKSDTPVFKQSIKNKVYAPGHNSFFTSPDGRENYILYHANSAPGEGCGSHRSPRAQKFRWTSTGTPIFGEPVPEGEELPIPSGTKVENIHHNPVLNIDFADPTVININGTYYAYATQSKHNGKMINIQVATSKDLFNWNYEGDALPQKPVWASHTQSFWAPDVLYDSATSQYVMFYCAKNDNKNFDKCIGVAFAKKPTGPFIDKGSPLIEGKTFTDIDPMAMTDPQTGKKLLYWGSGFKPIRVRELNDNWKGFKEGSVEKPLVFPGKENSYSKLIEGAWVDYYDGKYYLYYSGDNCCGDNANYAVMVARADNAFGPFERLGKFNGTGSSVILQKDNIWNAPGHNSIVKDNEGNIWIAYHAIWKDKKMAGNPTGTNNYLKRVMCIEPVVYRNGWPVVLKKY
ncbi:MAG: family 43 glycosylhydrolase [Bacteroidota bacterium]|nr:family 43 glycosylhydrolase [Bacteroidota bacterium]